MIDFSFTFAFFLFPLLIYFAMNKLGMPLIRLEVPSFLIVSMFVFAYMGILPLYFGWDEYRYVTGVQNKSVVLQVFLLSSLTIIGLLVGFFFAKATFSDRYTPITYGFRRLSKIETLFSFFLLLLSLAVLLMYLSKIPTIALFVALKDGVSEAKVARSIMGNDFPGKYHWYSIFMHDLSNVLTFIFFAAWLSFKRRLILALLLLSFSLSAFTALMATEKAPFIWLLIGLFCTYIIVKRGGVVPFKTLIMFTLLVIIILVFSYISFMGSSDAANALLSVFSRAFSGSISPAYFYLEFVPSHEDFLLGRSLQNPGNLLPFEPYNLAVEVKNWKFPDLNKSGVVGSMPAVFWAEIYANFGYPGVFVLPPFVGFAVYTISFYANKLENTPIKVGFVVWLLLHYHGLAFSGLSGYIFDSSLVVVFFMFLALIAFANKMTIKLRTKNRVYSPDT